MDIQYYSSQKRLQNEQHLKFPFTQYSCIIHPDRMIHGSAVIISSNIIPHHEVPAHQTNKIQAPVIQINTQPSYFSIAAIHFPPRHRIETEEALFHHQGGKFIVGGD